MRGRSMGRTIVIGTAVTTSLVSAAAQIALGVPAAPYRPEPPNRILTTAAPGSSLPRSVGNAVSSAAPPAGGSVTSSVVLNTVDPRPWTGYENAVYGADDETVFVAYKRFTQDPSSGGYVPAELRVTKSTNGGRSWSFQVVDADAIEEASTIDGSVSIDGDHAAAVYVAYHVRASGLFADMELRVAKSTDGGATWTTQTVADSNAGDHNSIRVVDASTVLVSAHAQGEEEGVHVYLTTDGGASWRDTLVEGGLGNGYYTSVGAAGLRNVFVAWYNSLYPEHTDLNAARRTRNGSWRTETVDGTPGDGDLTGLGTSIWVAEGPTAWIAYEEDTSQGAFVRVARVVPDEPGWTIHTIQQGMPVVGWNTAIHSVGSTNVYASYWHVDFAGTASPVLATSSDGGQTWSPLVIMDPRDTQPYLDSTAPSTAVQYVSYQTVDQAGDHPVLRLARIHTVG